MILLIILCSNVCVCVWSQSLEFNLKKGECCFTYLSNPEEPNALIPIDNIAYKNPTFDGHDARISVELNSEEGLGELIVRSWIDGFQKYDLRDRRKISDYKLGYPVGKDFMLGKVRISNQDGYSIVTQEFYHRTTLQRFEFNAIIAKDKEVIIKRIKIPESFVLWEWKFRDPFDLFAPFWKNFK